MKKKSLQDALKHIIIIKIIKNKTLNAFLHLLSIEVLKIDMSHQRFLLYQRFCMSWLFLLCLVPLVVWKSHTAALKSHASMYYIAETTDLLQTGDEISSFFETC